MELSAPERFGSRACELLLRATEPEGSTIPMPRALLVFAHPDDETVALGARLGRFSSARLVHVTDGAPRNQQDSRAHGFSRLGDYRRARIKELASSLHMAGLDRICREQLGIPDQEASLHLTELTERLDRIVEGFRPEVIFTHPYEGGHPDHDACAFAVHHALQRRQAEGVTPTPVVIECTFYHARQGSFTTGEFLPSSEPLPAIEWPLTQQEQQRKQERLACFTSQQETLRRFSSPCELFRVAPRYDFTQRPHPGQLLYDKYLWGVSSEQFARLAQQAHLTLAERGEVLCY